jgi:hypothetical protein
VISNTIYIVTLQIPSFTPTDTIPSASPTGSSFPSASPTVSYRPTTSSIPSTVPSDHPSSTKRPSSSSIPFPSDTPSSSYNPSNGPSIVPSAKDTAATSPPIITASPTTSVPPTFSAQPSFVPSDIPSIVLNDTVFPTSSSQPSAVPSDAPSPALNETALPSGPTQPNGVPSDMPSLPVEGTAVPTAPPTSSQQPSSVPSDEPPLIGETFFPSAPIAVTDAPSIVVDGGDPTISNSPSRSPTDVEEETFAPTSGPSITAVPSTDREIGEPTSAPAAPFSAPPVTLAPGIAAPVTIPPISIAPTAVTPVNSGPPTDLTMEQFLTRELTTGGEISVEGSPHNQALLALEASNPELDPNFVGAQQTILIRYALNVLYFFTGGAEWTNADGWTTSSDPCAWFGVTCLGIQLEVVALPDNRLVSRSGLPSELRAFTDLRVFDLNTNFIEGTLPTSIAELPSLLSINFGDNFFFFDAFPNEWESLLNLQSLELNLNSFSGTLSSRIGSLASLRLLDYTDNNRFEGGLGGNLPVELEQLTSLEILRLGDNDFRGFSESFAALSNLRVIDVHFNDFRDQIIPHIFAEFNDLQSADFSDNFFSGTLPESLMTRPSIVNLALNLNEITGSIPSTIDLPSVEVLNLGVNFIDGSFPAQFETLVSLKQFIFFDNFVNTTFPDVLLSLPSLEILNMQLNEMTGPLPGAYELPLLLSLNLAENFFSGEIPSGLFDLIVLTDLNLADNSFNSTIPTGFGLLTELRSLLLTNSQMTGAIPTELGSLIQVTSLGLGRNLLTGEIPTDLSALTELESFALDGNQFATTIPTFFGAMPNLRAIYLNATGTTSEIPVSLFSATSLQELYLQESNVTGTLPTEVGQLLNLGTYSRSFAKYARSQYIRLTLIFAILVHLNLESLQPVNGIPPAPIMSGALPTEVGGLVQLQTLRTGNNEFTGELPTELGLLQNIRTCSEVSFQFNQLYPFSPFVLLSLQNSWNSSPTIILVPSQALLDNSPACWSSS